MVRVLVGGRGQRQRLEAMLMAYRSKVGCWQALVRGRPVHWIVLVTDGGS